MSIALPASLRAAEGPVRRYKLAEVAKLIRQCLKEAFPDFKFSVRSHSYAGGASIDVRWCDGPAAHQVEPFVRCFSGAGFDGMRDMKYYRCQSLGGAPCSFDVDFVMCHREVSSARIDALAAQLEAAGEDMWLSIVDAVVDGNPCALVSHARQSAGDLAGMILRSAPVEAFKDRKSALAESVMLIDEGND